MATRQESVFFPAAPPIKNNTIEEYCDAIPSYPELLRALKKQGFFLSKPSIDYSMRDFLEKAEISEVDSSSFQLLTRSFPRDMLLKSMEHRTTYPKQFDFLATKIDCYIAMISDVLDNKLAKKPYEIIHDQENVTEKEHALQAGKISLLLSMDLGDILALLFHDIARPSINDPHHGHANHCIEGSTILSPLGLPTDFARHHAFAKHLLFSFCAPYKDLISPASQYSLGIQKEGFAGELSDLNKLDSTDLAFELYKLMFMRLIDDMSKVPAMELKKKLAGLDAEYFSPEFIAILLKTQISTHLNKLVVSSINIEEEIERVEAAFDSALFLLARSEEYSSRPEIYEQYKGLAALAHEFNVLLS